MKRILLSLFLALMLLPPANIYGQDKINWMDITELEEAMAAESKPVFFDVYTDWCGWCKRMDRTTFKNPEVVAFLNEKFHPVKFDAERKEDFTFMGHDFKFIASGRRGYNELAAALLNNSMSYPSYVALNEKFERITIIKGYQTSEELLTMLDYLGNKHYLKQTWQEYKASSGEK
jgi:thioredoxin-related protein